ncbi:MAG: efflux RND transporter periplasmic adaptor subunit [Draconibacterium sp.]
MTFIKKKYIWILLIVLSIIALLVYGSLELTPEKTYTVTRGSFELTLNVKGEIHGKEAVLITMPEELKVRDLRIHDIKIKDLIKEGSIVKKGDWVATLDPAAIEKQIEDNTKELEQRKVELNDARIDSSIELTQLREAISEFQYDLEYKEIELEQAKYESPAYQRKKKVEYNSTIRLMEKKRRDYLLREMNMGMWVKRREDAYNYLVYKDSLLDKARIACSVKAPIDGIVMAATLWGDRKIRIGDEISPWRPVIANLPDMSVLISETYVQEIDITKIAVGDSVGIYIDALPDNTYTGTIKSIANIGTELSGLDVKVFKVIIEIEKSGKEIKPLMTTDNKIVLAKETDVITIPRSCLFKEGGDSFVYLKRHGEILKKRVVAGFENNEMIVIDAGLNVKDKILTSQPEDADKIVFSES